MFNPSKISFILILLSAACAEIAYVTVYETLVITETAYSQFPPSTFTPSNSPSLPPTIPPTSADPTLPTAPTQTPTSTSTPTTSTPTTSTSQPATVDSVGPSPSSSKSSEGGKTDPVPSSCAPISVDFSAGQQLPSAFKIDYCPQNAVVKNGLLNMILTQECGTTISLANTISKYGKFTVVARMAPSPGAVTAFIFIGPSPSDEIDIEFVGTDTSNFQSMYFVNGQRIDQLAQYHTPGGDLSVNYHEYGIELLADRVNWFVDGNVVRTLARTDRGFPVNAAANVRLGVWDGSSVSAWAGTADFSTGPKTSFVKSFTFTPYC
ncbi:Beta-glucanase [Smittium mucronatum]|uniref:Beta-glucanase n=1 Tax=Smittium mucronatum TaxID=133383 RepID=A0A1R0H1M1_9FUNG|nr:Beta-glucanase [Smittium mucronatum]